MNLVKIKILKLTINYAILYRIHIIIDNESDQFSQTNITYLIFNKKHEVENITSRLI